MYCRYLIMWLIVGCFVLSLMIGCQSNLEENSSPVSEEVPDQEGWNSTIVFSHLGKRSSLIKYHYMQAYSKRNLIKFSNGVEILLFDEDGGQRSQIKSDEANLNEISNEISLSGNVSVVSGDGISLYSEGLLWNDENDEIVSEVPVMFITAEEDTIYGEGFESESSLENWEIKKPTGTSENTFRLKRDG